MPKKIPPAKLVLWDELHVSLYGPSDIRNNSVARRGVKKLMTSFRRVITECMKDRTQQSSVLKRFQIKVQS
jgi:hypothetical protein